MFIDAPLPATYLERKALGFPGGCAEGRFSLPEPGGAHGLQGNRPPWG
jgi:hypothetical protein